MLKTLVEFVKTTDFIDLLYESKGWMSLDVDYHPPRVLRLFRPVLIEGKEYRIYLHKILETDQPCLLHKHRWPSAILMIQGSYFMEVAYVEEPLPELSTVCPKPVACTILLREGSAYEMVTPHAVHSVKPETAFSLSVMLTGPVYQDVDIKEASTSGKLKPLSEADKEALLHAFRNSSVW